MVVLDGQAGDDGVLQDVVLHVDASVVAEDKSLDDGDVVAEVDGGAVGVDDAEELQDGQHERCLCLCCDPLRFLASPLPPYPMAAPFSRRDPYL